ncbi:MAG: hypothetical protein PHC61_08185 [Chitinivibrionales bacterium]|nr:hypothetical protein [Chitinivibrionales bacterium]
MQTTPFGTALFIVLAGTFAAFGQIISLTGAVVDAQTNAAVPGATVTLAGKNMTATTDAAGAFGFQNSTSVFIKEAPNPHQTLTISLRGGVMRIERAFGFTGNAVVELFDARGKRLFREMLKSGVPGGHEYTLPSLTGSGVFFLRVNGSGASIVRKLISAGGNSAASLTFAVQNTALAKTLATTLDSIVIDKSGYQTRIVTLATYQAQLDTILLFKTGATVWTERILNGDGSINWKHYENAAAHAGDSAQRDYLLGPKYEYYHAQAGTFPTLSLFGDADGWNGPAAGKPGPDGAAWSYNLSGWAWYTQAGALLYVADDPNNAGVISAATGEGFEYVSGIWPGDRGFWAKVYWDQFRGLYTYPVPPELSQPDWNSPKKPTAVASPAGISSPIAQYVAFQNGFIGTFAVDKCAYVHKIGCNVMYPTPNYPVAGNVFPWVQLPAGKVPMALAATPGGEFVLAAVWDVVNHKGQMAVIAVKNRVRCSETVNKDWNSYFETGSFMYGVPGWPNTKGLKLLGFVDLPIAAPTAIDAGTNCGYLHSGRDDTNVNNGIAALLDNQSERDAWYTGDISAYPDMKGVAHAGYAVIASRSENKVVFVDLQPLLQYYRAMYFTTQTNYDLTKNEGSAADQWPFTFDYNAGQKPVVASALDVAAPTAVAAGLSAGNCNVGCSRCNPGWNSWKDFRITAFADGGYAYITTLDGLLLIYAIGGLNTEAAATPPTIYKTVSIGKNPTSISYGEGGIYKNDFWINCRGDKSIYCFDASGNQRHVLSDSRIQDPVMAENSFNWLPQCGLHVVDFTGKKVLTYLFEEDFPGPMTFGAAANTPGHPFAYQQVEVP